ncbi:hypothetical protein M422DRAFT_271921 [Sphaerobolus stellatus SS14]|uniref:Uncharacterized protein n=1 Tax=Sphaerobolus stellatus (strain SS14) TaxID=990650 RepID=A0A0C9UNW0_SPHS4|nr:hypothetical protein M422DRAFT_271921 [Sphaerobolus stellatus SS14]
MGPIIASKYPVIMLEVIGLISLQAILPPYILLYSTYYLLRYPSTCCAAAYPSNILGTSLEHPLVYTTIILQRQSFMRSSNCQRRWRSGYPLTSYGLRQQKLVEPLILNKPPFSMSKIKPGWGIPPNAPLMRYIPLPDVDIPPSAVSASAQRAPQSLLVTLRPRSIPQNASAAPLSTPAGRPIPPNAPTSPLPGPTGAAVASNAPRMRPIPFPDV